MNTDRIYYSRDAEIQAIREKTVMAMILMAVGMSIGAVLALLFAPAAGSETRHDVAHTVEAGIKDGRESVEPLVKRLEHEIADLRQRFHDRMTQS
jgi:gas vesicle protein